MRTASSLRAERTRCTSPRARESSSAVAARHPHDGAGLAVGAERHRAEQLEADRRREQGERVVDGAGLAGDRREPGGGRQVRLATLRGLAGGEAGRVPADQRLHRRVGGVADDDRAAAGADQADGVGPAPQRLLLDPQVGQAEHQPGVEQDDGGVATGRPPARRPGWRRRWPARRRPRPAPGRRPTCGPRCRRTSGPAPRRCGSRPRPVPAGRGGRTRGRPRPRRPLPHHRQVGGAVADAERQRAGADPAAGRGAAALAGEGRGVARCAGSAPAPARSRARRGSRGAPRSAPGWPGPAGRGPARARRRRRPRR